MRNEPSAYRNAGVDVQAADRAVDLMKSAVASTHGAEVMGGFGGFAGLFDASALAGFTKPLLATSTDGVGTKVAFAQALDRHDTIGQDLVGMVVDDIVAVGARPLFMTDYIACGRLLPERIAAIVEGIARACKLTGVALVGGETAEHPGLLGPDEYDLAGAAVGAVEADQVLGAHKVREGDVVIALASSGLHSNGFSLVRQVLSDRGLLATDYSEEFGSIVGEALLEPTRLYSSAILSVLETEALVGDVHALAHVTGGGIAANLARVLPQGMWAEVDRSTWAPLPVFRILAELGELDIVSTESVWNLGVGFMAVVEESAAAAVISALSAEEIVAWVVGVVSGTLRDMTDFEQNAKGVRGGAVRLISRYAS